MNPAPASLPKEAYRLTKIIFTLGPASADEKMLEQLILAGVDVCRLNMAHADHAWTRNMIQRVRAVCARTGRHIALLMDVKGPEIRTGDLAAPVELAVDQLIDLLPQPGESEHRILAVSVNYPGLGQDVPVGSTILVDSGLIRLEVVATTPARVRCRVVVAGRLGNRRHINLPGIKVRLPALTAKDRADVALGVAEGIDFFALSFVREADDIDILRRCLTEQGSTARIIAKIEDQSAIANLDEIIAAADAVMVARGDLGIEVPMEELPLIQKRAVDACIRLRKPVIVATHLLESMIQSPVPTRAEVSDIASAVWSTADAIMLSGETTTGRYPLECVQFMKRVAGRIEGSVTKGYNTALPLKTHKDRLLRSAITLAQEIGESGVVVFTRSGLLPQTLSALRATRCPIYAFTDNPHAFRHLLLVWGVEPFLMDFAPQPEETIRGAFAYLLRRGWVQPGDWLVVVTNVLAGEQTIDTIQLRPVE
ncbi:Pyruvate kinase [Lacunisphaera limnophila]|uniref:Pyruvate kinase n=1 Tax=Lacunisphaera limnophila TaxID=1838286 RepID=A0A1D8AS26_9BACT|nr:pyruvate kinase [Lacunisphaera limnophila]AOS43701.1 Pyruvate kinase [Lacunisphaera limnophila]